jgi:hypothetical protein
VFYDGSDIDTIRSKYMAEPRLSDPKQIAALTQQIVKILADEDSDSRRRAVQAAMMVLGELPASAPEHQEPEHPEDNGDSGHSDLAVFFARDGKLKPSDTAFLCAAYHYSQFGPATFSVDEIQQIAAGAGVVIPDRVDKTLLGGSKDGKKLFQSIGKGSFRATASAGLYFKEKWNVKPGRKAKAVKEAH